MSADVPPTITLATAWDENAKGLLRNGRKVLLVVPKDSLPLAVNAKPTRAENYKSRAGTLNSPIPGNFTPVFWSMLMKRGQLAQTMGLLCDPAHPALAGFPTEFHSNWQWWDPVMHSAVMQIDPLPKALRPIVGVVDNFRYNQRLAMVFEAKVSGGKLIVCSSDILNGLDERPVARQLRRSLLDYMASPDFSPAASVTEAALDEVLLRRKPTVQTHDPKHMVSVDDLPTKVAKDEPKPDVGSPHETRPQGDTVDLIDGNVGVSHCAISLAGKWQLKLGAWTKPEDRFDDEVVLPGSLDENRKGTPNAETKEKMLSRRYAYLGPAVYQRAVDIPVAWRDKKIQLFLERTRPTRLWIDGKLVGEINRMTTPHVYDVTARFAPGVRHVLAIEVDNSYKGLPTDRMRYSHLAAEDTQTNWHGILGRIELQATDKVCLQEILVYPDVANRKARVVARIGKDVEGDAQGTLTLQATSWNSSEPVHEVPAKTFSVACRQKESSIELEYEMGEGVRLWDEFTPALYRLEARLDAASGGKRYQDARSVDFGMREFKARGTQFAVNGKTVFLRGEVNCAVFPLTGYVADGPGSVATDHADLQGPRAEPRSVPHLDAPANRVCGRRPCRHLHVHRIALVGQFQGVHTAERTRVLEGGGRSDLTRIRESSFVGPVCVGQRNH